MPRLARSRSRRGSGHVVAAALVTVSIAAMATPLSTLAVVMREGKRETAREERAEPRDMIVLNKVHDMQTQRRNI